MPRTSSSSCQNPPLAGCTVLVVEDVWLIADAMRSILEGAGARVLGPCHSLGHAVGMLARERPDIAVVDLCLGGSMAYDLIESLRRLAVPTVIATGQDSAADAGPVAAVLAKPMRADELLAAVACAARSPQPA